MSDFGGQNYTFFSIYANKKRYLTKKLLDCPLGGIKNRTLGKMVVVY